MDFQFFLNNTEAKYLVLSYGTIYVGWSKDSDGEKDGWSEFHPCHWLSLSESHPKRSIFLPFLGSERITVVRVPCIVRQTSVMCMGAAQDSLWQVHNFYMIQAWPTVTVHENRFLQNYQVFTNHPHIGSTHPLPTTVSQKMLRNWLCLKGFSQFKALQNAGLRVIDNSILIIGYEGSKNTEFHEFADSYPYFYTL